MVSQMLTNSINTLSTLPPMNALNDPTTTAMNMDRIPVTRAMVTMSLPPLMILRRLSWP